MNTVRVALAASTIVALLAGVPSVGHGQSEDTKQLRLAAEQGDPTAQNSLGRMYAKGEGVIQDSTEAEKWFRRAAENGLAEAQFNLAIMYFAGRGVPRDYSESMHWARLAAEQGDLDAMLMLGTMYTSGRGEKRDSVLGHKWLNLAAALGSGAAGNLLTELELSMKAVQIDEAQRLAREWWVGEKGVALQRARRREAEATALRAEVQRRKEAEQARKRRELEMARQRRLEHERKVILAKALEEYIGAIQSSVTRNWRRPTGVPRGLKCTVSVVQAKNGKVLRVEIAQSSGNVAFDRSVEQAVRAASPLPLPRQRAVFEREILFLFNPRS